MDGLRQRPVTDLVERARAVKSSLPAHGLFAGQTWRIAPVPFALGEGLAGELEDLGRVVLQFYRALNLLYRQSVAGRQPEWIAALLDQGKPEHIIQWQRDAAFKNALPRVLRPDLILTEKGMALTELDSVPGGIGLTAWLNQAYSKVCPEPELACLGGARGMIDGFAGIFGDAPRVHLVVSDESAMYRPEMEWMAQALGQDRFAVRDDGFADIKPGDAVYRFFEMFDAGGVRNSNVIFELARQRQIELTPPPKPFLEEKLMFALLWNRNLREYWRRELGEGFLSRLQRITPYTWVLDPAPLPPHAAYPELGLTHWSQLKVLSQRERALILKVSGFCEQAWGARGVHLGSDMSQAGWSAAVNEALASFTAHPFILQRFQETRLVDTAWCDMTQPALVPMKGRVRLCPYYFVHGDGDASRAHLGGVLATLCPSDKKILHGMKDAILAPCSV